LVFPGWREGDLSEQ